MKDQVVTVKDNPNQHYRVISAKWIFRSKEWKVFLRDESDESPNGLWQKMDQLQPQFNYEWFNASKNFWFLPDKIAQCDGDIVTDEQQQQNIGVELGQMTANMTENAEEIEAICEEIATYGIDDSNMRKNTRFNNTGLATNVNKS